jgi:pyruvate carboxylase
MRTDTMLPTAEKMDQVGFFSLEAWGGATFDVAIRFLNEDAWERIRQLKRHVKRTPLWRRNLSIRCCLTEFRAEPESPRKIIALCINDSTTS